MRLNLNEVRDELIRHLKAGIELVQKTEMPAVKEPIVITMAQIKDEKVIKEIASTLPDTGCHIYWFEVNDPEGLLCQYNNRELMSEYKLARNNKGTDSKYVYVGSCTRIKLSNRFKQHCGWGYNQTYSLQLQKWIGETDLIFTFSYAEISDSSVTAYLEDQLHRQLKPLFGKPGANNKIVKN